MHVLENEEKNFVQMLANWYRKDSLLLLWSSRVGIKKAIGLLVPGKLISFLGLKHHLQVCSVDTNTSILVTFSV